MLKDLLKLLELKTDNGNPCDFFLLGSLSFVLLYDGPKLLLWLFYLALSDCWINVAVIAIYFIN